MQRSHMKQKVHIDLSLLGHAPTLDMRVRMEIRPLAPLSMVSEMPGSFYKSLIYPSKKMICGLLENMLGWHFDKKMRNDIFNDWKKAMKKQKITVNLKDYQQGSTYIPLLMDYFDISEKPYLADFQGMCNYSDLWNRCYRREGTIEHLNGCRNLDVRLIPKKSTGFSELDKKYDNKKVNKEKKNEWVKENDGQIPCFYTTPTNREYVDINAVYCIPLNIDKSLYNMLDLASSSPCYLGNSEGWVQVYFKRTEL